MCYMHVHFMKQKGPKERRGLWKKQKQKTNKNKTLCQVREMWKNGVWSRTIYLLPVTQITCVYEGGNVYGTGQVTHGLCFWLSARLEKHLMCSCIVLPDSAKINKMAPFIHLAFKWKPGPSCGTFWRSHTLFHFWRHESVCTSFPLVQVWVWK